MAAWDASREAARAVADALPVLQTAESVVAYFMVPRYIDFIPELPKTPTGKIRKFPLRETGVTSTTWDREAAGVRLRG